MDLIRDLFKFQRSKHIMHTIQIPQLHKLWPDLRLMCNYDSGIYSLAFDP